MGRIRSRFHLQMQQPSRRLTTESLEPRIQLTSVPVISEFQAVNRTTIQDEDGDFSDWIEIWNPSLEAVNLDGWYLTDDSSNLKKWQIPTVAVPAKQQILVFASGKNRANEAELHTNFKLSRDGEYLALVDPNGNVTDDFGPNYPKQVEDQSFGLFISRDSTVLLRDHSPVSAFVPTDNSLGVEWTDVDFQDADWQTGLGGVGFENLRPAFSAREDFESLDNWTIDIPPSSQAIVNSNAGIHFSLQSGENTSTAQRGSAPLVFRDLPAVDARKWEMVAHVEKVKPSDRGSIGIMIYDADTGKPALMLEQSVRRTFHFSTGQLNFDFSKRQDGSFFLRIARDDVEKTWSAYVKVNEFDEWELLGSVRDGDHGVPVIADPKPGVFARTPSGTLDARITTVEFHVGEQIPNFAPDIGLDVTERMAQQNSSIYIRKSFEVDVDPRRFDLLELGARFNDGFKAYLNGVEITSQNAPPMSNWKSSAIETRFPSKNTQRIEIPDLSLLQKGMNILAIHGMSATANDEEFFFNSNLTASTRAGVFNSFPSSPTPGAPNALPNAPSPMLLSDEGVFYGSKTVALQLDETHDNLEIRYTLDGSLPTKESNLFSGPFTIDKSVMLQARTFDTLPLPNFELSNITSGTFISVASELRERTSDIPLMIIDTLEQELPDGTTNFLQAANVGLFDVGAAEQRSSIDNSVIDYLGRGGVPRRGSSTAGSPKPSMAFETWGPNGSQQDDDFDASLLGLAPDSDWILYAPFGYDRTFLRNRLAFELSNQMGMWAAGTRFIEVYFNEEDGVVSEDDYVGVYVLMEKIKQGNHRVDIAEIGPSENSLEKISGGYIWKLDRRDSDALPFRGNINWVYPKSPFSVSARDDQKATLVQQAWVNDFFDAFEATLENPEINDPDGYSKFIDVQAWIDQNILNAMMWNVDAFNFSAFFHKDRAGKLVYGPVWDFNISSGSLSSGYDNPLVWGPIFFERQWFSELFRDPGFWQQYIDRWHMWRRTVLSDDNINSIISRLFEEVAESAERNSARWLFAGRTFGTFDHFGNLDGSFKGEINHLRDWLATRTSFIDANFPETPLYRLDDQIVHDIERIQVSVGQNVEIVAAPIEVFDATILVSGEPGHTDARYFVPADDELSDLWTLSEFDDSQWKRRPTGYGYDDDDGFDALIGTVVDPRAVKKGATNILLRIPFHISSDIDLESSKLILRMKYNGGYVAHINGVRVRLENISSEIAWDAKVTGRSDDDAIEYHDVDLSRFNEMMVEGENILAIRAINSSARSSDMLVLPELVVRYTRQVNDPETDVFFTIDGSDPRRSDGEPSPTAIHVKSQSQVAIKADTRIIARSFDSSDRGPESQIVLTDWSAPRRVDFLISGEPLVISEVNYHPQPPTSSEIAAGHDEADDFEFIEIVNTTSFTQELSDLQLVQVGRDGNQDGVVFDFSKGIISTIQPNQRIVVVEDLDAFKFRYGDDFPVAGQWSGGLSNSSEMISLYSGDRKVQQFTYDDSWYPETDGVGKTLEIINGRNSNLESWSLRESWRPSALIGGTPGNPMLSDFNSDHTLSAIDIELLFSAIRTGSNDPRFDLNQDQTVDQLDRDLWLKIFGTGFGDTDLDGSFNSRDLVQIFVAGEYEDAIIGNSTWEEGDWDGDGEFSSSDLVLAFQNGRYEFE